MANWNGTARSNYVRTKDMDGLKAALAPFPIRIDASHIKPGYVCLLSEESDSGGWPSFARDEDENEIEFDPAVQICPFMEDGEILVIMEAGAERLRYVTGHAQAYTAKGKRVSVSIDDIYEKAARAFGVGLSSISRCEY